MRAIRPAGRADVYNMEVEDTHDFAVGGGVIVHNCYDELRYVCMAYPIAPRLRVKEPPRPYDPLSTDQDTAYGRYAFYQRF